MQPNNPQRPNAAGQRPQFFDVVRPGRTPASPTSRPVLPNNRTAVPDTSMKLGAPAVPPGLMQQQNIAAPPPVPAPVSVAPAPVPLPQQYPQSSAPRLTPPPTQSPMRPAPVTPVFPQRRYAQSQPAVSLSPTPQPQPAPPQKQSVWSEVLAIIAIVLLVLSILDILLDAEILNLPLPHTNFFDY